MYSHVEVKADDVVRSYPEIYDHNLDHPSPDPILATFATILVYY
jgi:hypothetical protein